MMIRALTIIVFVSLCSVAHAVDFGPGPPATNEEMILSNQCASLLRQGDYTQLDKTMSQFQADYESGKRDDVNLLHLFRAFYDTNLALEKNYDTWIAAYPHSYVAREARATFYRRVGMDARGQDYVNTTSDQQLETMQTYIHRAMNDHNISVKLTAKPILTYGSVLTMAMLDGNQPLADDMLLKANAADPNNFFVRFKYMMMLQTRWGGSLEKMIKFRATCQKQGMSAEKLYYFDELINSELVWLNKKSSTY